MLSQNNLELLFQLLQHRKYNRKDYFEPYDYQREFIDAGSTYLQRAFSAGNRTGKSETGAYEMACHLTGDYPDWWKGYRCDTSGHDFIAVGISLDSTRRILQEKLFGTADCRLTEDMGTGMLPRDSIVFSPMEKDGARIKNASIKHKDGGTNTIHFFGAGNEKDFMGMTLKGVWIDESDKTQCLAIYSQAVTRTVTTNGFVIQTFTPENGMDDVIKKYIDANAEDSPQLKLFMASMYDAHISKGGHITDAMIEKVKSGCPEFEWECRIYGIPSAGSGAVFPLNDSDIVTDDVIVQPHWPIVGSFDIGKVVDPTVLSIVTRDDTDTIILLEQHVLQGGIYDKDPKALAEVILNGNYPHMIVVSPHDGGIKSANPESYAKLLEEYGVNVYADPFRNPTATDLGMDVLTQQANQSNRAIETGLQTMRTRFKEGTLKVMRQLDPWFKEKRKYFYTEKGVPNDADNHCIDSSRYAIMSLLNNIYSTAQVAQSGNTTNWRNVTPNLRF